MPGMLPVYWLPASSLLLGVLLFLLELNGDFSPPGSVSFPLIPSHSPATLSPSPSVGLALVSRFLLGGMYTLPSVSPASVPRIPEWGWGNLARPSAR